MLCPNPTYYTKMITKKTELCGDVADLNKTTHVWFAPLLQLTSSELWRLSEG